MTNIAIIPARGGSKGIPRKNLRPLAGFPLIYYSISATLASTSVHRVVVSTDDEEIALFAKRFGAEVITRSSQLANDTATLDPVIFDAVIKAEKEFNETYEYVVTIQPTSPLVTPIDIDNAVQLLSEKRADSVLSVVDDRHLQWSIQDGVAVPKYAARLNRQELPACYRETGAIIACTRSQLNTGERIGQKVEIYETSIESSFDIDTYADLYLCEAMLTRKKVVFVVTGYPEVGLGHAYRAVMLAHELTDCSTVFICDHKSALAAKYIKSMNYSVIMAPDDDLVSTIAQHKPDLVINDILDTSEQYVRALKENGFSVINFEDLGSGHFMADVTINALYSGQDQRENVLVGPDYFCLRDEFLFLPRAGVRSEGKQRPVKKILITFGGVDEGNITVKAVQEIACFCARYGLMVEIVLGPGYEHKESLLNAVSDLPNFNCSIVDATQRISEHMRDADIAITSGGRTVLELASLRIPTIVICQNHRETTHSFASEKNGVINLGHYETLRHGQIQECFGALYHDAERRKDMMKRMDSMDLASGKSRVVSVIRSLIKR